MENSFQVISPVDESIYLERRFASAGEIEKVLSNSQRARKGWQHTTIQDRGQLCLKLIDYFLQNADEIAIELTRQMGRPIIYSPYEITKGFRERAEYMIEIAQKSLENISIPHQSGFKRYIQRDPLGTVFVLAPWNYPYLTSVNAIIPAIMSGNTVILKHATQTPLCAERYARAFESAGFPPGIFQFLHLQHDQAADIIEDKRIDYVAFTGSVAGGQAIQGALGKRFINAGLELGGKDPAYVRADSNLENAVENLVDGSFFNSGQSCCGIERIYVHEDVFNTFVEQFVEMTRQYRLGDPLDPSTNLGPMVRTSSASFCRDQIKKAVSAGAHPLIDTSLFDRDIEGSSYHAPQVLINVDHNMEIMKEETFGPVVGIMSVKNDQEAIDLMNDSAYGLTASVWTNDLKIAQEMGQKVETGTFFMNRCDYLDPALAWTGVKNSGRGCTLSPLGYEVLTRPKSFHLKLS